MGKDIKLQRTRKRFNGYRDKFLSLSPEEQEALDKANGYKSTMDWRDPPIVQTSKGRNAKRHAYKRAKRQEQSS